MNKKELEEKVMELYVENEVTKRVKLRCIAFWSTVMMVAGSVGAFCAAYIKPIKAAARAFWDAL
jgi:uncharacterized membrane protein